MRPSIVILGDDVIADGLNILARDANDLDDAFDAIGDTLTDMIGQQFDSQGREFGTPWDPLTDDTIAAKERAGYSSPTKALVATGAMAGSVDVRTTDDGLEVTMLQPRTAYHHGEQRSASNPVPRRPVFDWTAALEAYVTTVLQRQVFGGITQRWRGSSATRVSGARGPRQGRDRA